MSNVKKGSGISLLKKSKKGFLSAIFSRLGLIVILLLLQIVFLSGVFIWFEDFLPHIYGGSVVFSAFMVMYLLNSRTDPTAKITWLVVIMLLPVFGALLYLYTKADIGHGALKKRVNQINEQTQDSILQSEETFEALREISPESAALAKYINRNRCSPVFTNTQVTYFPLGENKFEAMLDELEKAENFIFLEYFIVSEGVMWGKTLEILARKAAEGVDVRMMYDGTCEFSTLPHDYPARLEKLGIKCKMFAPLTPFVSTHYNYRDHRKILVIDGHTAFNGGINLADEYINLYEKHGHWKDTAVMLKGEAVSSFTLMFLQMWNLNEKHTDFKESIMIPDEYSIKSDGFVIPYGDCPLDSDKVGERVYIDILNRAQKYVYIMTPYLILDGSMEDAIKFAAERGTDVRILLPGIPDKKIPYSLALTHYASLIDSGVRIFEYTPGFVHAKVFVSDDTEAVVGTINLDYRSLYHHFECATYMYGVDCIPDIKNDYLQTQLKCAEVTANTLKRQGIFRKICGFVMKALAPLL